MIPQTTPFRRAEKPVFYKGRPRGFFCFLAFFFSFLGGLFAPLSSGHAAQFSGAYLLHVCDSGPDGRETVKGGHTACQAYIAGVVDYHNMLRSMKIAPQVDICVPERTAPRQIQDVVLAYLKAHPEHDSFVAAPAVTMALYDVFPCR
ncbi:MAG: hypothetical protein KDJ15_07090 [Alphaproteobacteria bacterium]|nr:hypothetical protein [Alphaproteobacteria bacterium]